MPMKKNEVHPSGLTYNDAHDIVETIVSMKKGKYNYPGHDPEDLAQDIRIMCWEALDKFDNSKVGKSVFHFVAKCVDNGLYNKFRGIYLDNNPPCLRCPEYIKETKECAIQESGCTRIVQYRERMARKRAIAAPLSYNASLDADGENDFTSHQSLSVGSTTGAIDLDATLRHSLDSNLIEYYEIMIGGGTVPSHIKRLIQQQVRSILEKNDD